MGYKVVKVSELALHEFIHIEAEIQNVVYRKLSGGISSEKLRNGISQGMLVVLSDIPTTPLLFRGIYDDNGKLHEFYLNPKAKNLVSDKLVQEVLKRASSNIIPLRMDYGSHTDKKEVEVASDKNIGWVSRLYPDGNITRLEYNVKFYCPDYIMKRFGYFDSQMYLLQEDQRRNYDFIPSENLEAGWSVSTVSLSVTTSEYSSYDFIIDFITIRSSLSLESVEVFPMGTRQVDDSFYVLKPTLEYCGKLGFPSKGYYYHFIGKELAQEFSIDKEAPWFFKRTKSRGRYLSYDEYGTSQFAIMVAGSRHGIYVGNQYLVYLNKKITSEELNSVDMKWLMENGVYVDTAYLWNHFTQCRDLLSNNIDTINYAPLHIDRTEGEFIGNSTSILKIKKQVHIEKHIPLINLKCESNTISFIVNIILPCAAADERNDLSVKLKLLADTTKSVVEKIKDGLGDAFFTERVAIILGVNAKKGMEKELGDSKDCIVKAIETIGMTDNIKVVAMVFEKLPFPYGEMRNKLLYSDETKEAIQLALKKEYFPYISIQDFDIGSRRVDSGVHIFRYIEGVLNEGGRGYFIRPMMIAGGYRPIKTNQINDDDNGFSAAIQEDMAIRNKLARIDPTLPYAPEPNLFFDANLILPECYGAHPGLMAGREKKQFGPVQFSSGSAEYFGLSESLSEYNMAELEKHYTDYYNNLMSDGDASTDIVEVKARLDVDSQNNRHPTREISFLVDFNMTVETDLSRLKTSYEENENTMAQKHDIKMMQTNIFATKPAKYGVRWAETLKEYEKFKKSNTIPELGVVDARTADSYIKTFIGGNASALIGHPGAKFVYPQTVVPVRTDKSKVKPSIPFRANITRPFNPDGIFKEGYYNVAPTNYSALSYKVITTFEKQ
jgi:hypothetical protein